MQVLQAFNPQSSSVSPQRGEQWQQRSLARRQMVADVEMLLGEPAGALRWTGSKRDLVALVHAACRYGRFVGPDGALQPFVRLLCRVYWLLGLVPPRNPYAYVSRDRDRKGALALPVEEKYRLVMERYGRSPVEQFVARTDAAGPGRGGSWCRHPSPGAGHSFPALPRQAGVRNVS